MTRDQRLQQTLFDLQTRYGDYAIQSAKVAPLRAIPTGFAALDEALNAGGIVCGRITVLMSIGTSGALTVAYHLLAQAQAEDKFAAYLDLSSTFDPEEALHCGVALNRVLIIRLADVTLGIEIARDIVLANAAPLIVIDLWGLTDPLPHAALDRLADAVIRAQTAVVCVVDGDHAELESAAHTWLTFERQRWQFDSGRYKHGRLCGYETRVTIRKDKPHPKVDSVTLHIDHGERLT